MTVYYYQNGFLHTDDTPPEGAVALTAADKVKPIETVLFNY